MANDSTPLSDLQQAKAVILQLKAEVIQLRMALTDRDARLASIDLNRERDALTEEFVTACGGDLKAGDTWNWQTMNIKHPDPVEPKK